MMFVAASGPNVGSDARALATQEIVNDHVDLWVALSPVSYMNNQQSWLLWALSHFKLGAVVTDM